MVFYEAWDTYNTLFYDARCLNELFAYSVHSRSNDARISETSYISQADVIHLHWISVNGKKQHVYKKQDKRNDNTSRAKVRLLS